MEVYGNNPEMIYYGTISSEYIRDDILNAANDSSKMEILYFERIFYPKLISMIINRVGVKNVNSFLDAAESGLSLTELNRVYTIMDSISKLPLEEDESKLKKIKWCNDMRVSFDESKDLSDDKLMFILKKIKVRRSNPVMVKAYIMQIYILNRLKHISMSPYQFYTTFDKVMIESLWWTK